MNSGPDPRSKITSSYRGRHILSLSQFTPASISILFKKTDELHRLIKRKKPVDFLQRSVATLLFFEPSTRTFVSFSSAIKKLGGSTIDILSPGETSSFAKGESLSDSVKVFSTYTDIIIVRHPEKGFADRAASVSSVPVINAGDGEGEHPTQTLYDLYTIHQKFRRLDGLKGLVMGDVRNSRSIHSLLRGLALYKRNTIYLLSPKELFLTPDFKKSLPKTLTIIEITKESDIPVDCDFWYSNRLQKERVKGNAQKILKNFPVITPTLLARYGNKKLILLDPLPRVGNIDEQVDQDPRAVYLTNQLENGLFVRAALVALVLGKL